MARHVHPAAESPVVIVETAERGALVRIEERWSLRIPAVPEAPLEGAPVQGRHARGHVGRFGRIHDQAIVASVATPASPRPLTLGAPIRILRRARSERRGAMSAVVWRGMNRATLDVAYNNAAAVAGSADWIARWTARTRDLRARHPEHLDLA